MIDILKTTVPDEILKEIGDITVSFAVLEAVTRDLLDGLIGIDQELAQTITTKFPLKDAGELAMNLYLKKYEKDRDYETLHYIVTQSDKVRQRRNQIIHSMWRAGKTANTVSRIAFSAKKNQGLRINIEEIDKKNLTETTREIKALTFMIIFLYSELTKAGKA